MAVHKIWFYGFVFYSILTTTFSAIRSEVCKSDFKDLFLSLWIGVNYAFDWLIMTGKYAAKLGDKIPNHIVAVVVH